MLRGSILLWVATASFLVPPWVCAGSGAHGCGVAAVIELATLLGQDVGAKQRELLTAEYPRVETSMLDVQRAALSLGIDLVGLRATLAELEAISGPKILHLRSPEHFVVLARSSPQWLQVIDRHRVVVLTRAKLRDRYTGHALVLERRESAAHGPVVSVPSFYHSFWARGAGQEVRHTFQVWNRGDEDLVISPGSVACRRAIDVALTDELVLPGRSGAVTVGLTLPRFAETTESVKLVTNDVDCPVLLLTIHAKVPEQLEVAPDRLRLGVAKGKAATAVVRVTGPDGLRIKEARCGQDVLQAVVGEPRLLEGGLRVHEVEVRFTAGTRVGEVMDVLTIAVTHPDCQVITVPIHAKASADLQVEPQSVFFGFVPLRQAAHRDVIIRSVSGSPFSLKHALPDSPRIQLGSLRRRDAAWLLPVSVETGRAGVVDGHILVATDVPGEEHLKVHVYAHIVDSKGALGRLK